MGCALGDLESCMREKGGSDLHVFDSSRHATSLARIRKKKLRVCRRPQTKNDERFCSVHWNGGLMGGTENGEMMREYLKVVLDVGKNNC